MYARRWLLLVLFLGVTMNWGGGEAIRGAPRAAAAEEAPTVSHAGKTVEQWINDLADEEDYVREEAADALEQLGKPAIPALIDALQRPDVRIRRGAAQILGKLGAITPDVVPALTQALRDGDDLVRNNAEKALERIGVDPTKPVRAESPPRGQELRTEWVLSPDKQLVNLPRFGEELFVRAGVAAVQAAAGVPVAPEYILGPGDQLAIRCWGEAITHLDTTVMVSAQGNIYLALLGEIPAAGQTLEAIGSLLAQRLREFYADSQTFVTVSATRVITIYLTGDVKRPGKYQLGGAATVLAALYAAGGPATAGSLRKITWISRAGATRAIDLYPYLLRGEPLPDLPLHTEDTIFVGPIGSEIGVTGQVQRPARYELAETITCLEAIELAGGLTPSAYTEPVQVWRVADHQQQTVINVHLRLGSSSAQMVGADFQLQAGDVVVVPSVLPIPENAVRISGAVRRRGIYEVEEGMRLSDLINKAQGLDEGAYLGQAAIRRLNENRQPQYTSFSVEEVLAKRDGADLAVQPYDEVRIYYRHEVTPLTYVAVRGPVQNAGEYQWIERLTIRDLITQAGGVTENAYLEEALLLRYQSDGNRHVFPVQLAEALDGQVAANLTLEPGDVLEISTREDVMFPYVEVRGPVENPESYPWAKELTVKDLVTRAGGVSEGAYLDQARLLRRQPDGNRQVLKVQLAQALQGDPQANLALQPADILEISTREETIPPRLVHIHGFIQAPANYRYFEEMKISDLIFAAGGLLPGAGHTAEYTPGRFEGEPEIQELELIWEQEDQVRVVPDLVLKPDDQVTVPGVGDFHRQPDVARITGQIAHPGAKVLHSSTEKRETLYELLQRCGPLLPDANPDGIVVYRYAGEMLGPNQQENLRHIMRLFNRERVTPVAEEEAELQQAVLAEQGAVQAAQIFSQQGATSLVIPPRQLSLSDWITGIPIEGSKLLASQGQRYDLPLRRGDTVVVPRVKSTVAVLGAVVRPGLVPYQQGARVMHYVRQVGGLAEDAAMRRTVVIRVNSTVVAARAAGQIKPGDVILVPSTHILRTMRTQTGFEQVLRAVGGIAATILLVN